MNRYDVVVAGAGAAGLVAAERAAARGRRTLLLEKNRKPGVKILMSGGTRCNLTHATDARGIVAAYGPPGRFLHSALAALGPADLVALVEGEGVATKVEETGKIFPVSNKAADVLGAFTARLRRTDCEIALGEPLVTVERMDGGFRIATPLREVIAEKLIVTVGGQSYPGCGTTGDGYEWARALGHTVVPPRPALVPVTTSAAWVPPLSGVTIPDVLVKVVEQAVAPGSARVSRPRRIPDHSRRGSFLFTHFGLSGPAVLDVSRAITAHANPAALSLVCDFLPDLPYEQVDQQIRHEAAAAGKRQLGSLIGDLVPRRLADALVSLAGLSAESKAGELGRDARTRLVAAIKQAAIPVHGTRGFSKAEVTAGGVSLDEVDSRTMQSKLVPNLYWAGEILDLDGPIGGYNFQSAFSTGWLAGLSV